MQTFLTPLSGNVQQLRTTPYDQFFRSIVAFGYSGFISGVPQNNAGTVYLGYNTGALPYQVSAGGFVNIDVPQSFPNAGRDNLANVWVKGTSGDGLYVVLY